MENLITVKNVKGYVDEKGTAYLTRIKLAG